MNSCSLCPSIIPFYRPVGKMNQRNIAMNNVGWRSFLQQTCSQNVALSFDAEFFVIRSLVLMQKLMLPKWLLFLCVTYMYKWHWPILNNNISIFLYRTTMKYLSFLQSIRIVLISYLVWKQRQNLENHTNIKSLRAFYDINISICPQYMQQIRSDIESKRFISSHVTVKHLDKTVLSWKWSLTRI